MQHLLYGRLYSLNKEPSRSHEGFAANPGDATWNARLFPGTPSGTSHPDDHDETRRVWSTSLTTGSASEVSFRVRNAHVVAGGRALKATANCLLPLELRNEGSAGWPRRSVLAKGHPHWKAHIARRAFDADLDQRTAVKVRLHHVQGHVSPSQPGLEKGVLRSEIREAPGQRRQDAEISALR